MTSHEKRVNALMRLHGLSKAAAEKRAKAIEAKPTGNPAPKRKTAARTMKTATAYVKRPSQVTKKSPSKRLTTRRVKNLQAPRGVFPNPSPRGAKFTVAQINKLRDEYSKIERINPDSPTYIGLIDRLDSLPQSTLKQLADAKIRWVSTLAYNRTIRKNPSTVHFDIDVNSHNARGSKAKTRTNPIQKTGIKVQKEHGGSWLTFAEFPKTAQGAKDAIEYAKAYHAAHPSYKIRVME